MAVNFVTALSGKEKSREEDGEDELDGRKEMPHTEFG